MLSRTRNFPKVAGITIVQPFPWSLAAQRVIQGFKSLKPFIEKLGHYLDIIPDAPPPPEAKVSSHIERRTADPYYVGYYVESAQDLPPVPQEEAKSHSEREMVDPYYVGYYTNVSPEGSPPIPQESAKNHMGRKKSDTYYEDQYYIEPASDPALVSEESAQSEIERQWKGEIERYIKMGGEKNRFIDFIRAAKTGFPDERDREANDKVKSFRESFINKASREDIVHVMELHENIRGRLERSKSNSLAGGDERTYQECSGRISRLDRGKRQLQFVLKRKSSSLVS